MIRTFRHKGLKAFFQTGTTKGIRADHAKRLVQILGLLDLAMDANDMNLPGFDLHPLKGNLVEYWSVSVNGNWRIIFRFIEGHAELVDYLDYH
ncbi:MAG: type II toxin-antitoxin system RelE/ParE family toxin [Pseudomonas sp.]|jgi:proteic killer suppression protein|uniref:type II toxin-antitoxin system RelE/ParE family toxin n=1 Tax=Pseudomonas sp. TaxID=306 RepID=UPI0023880386|nr:type II toxin-antitoxin system RelE/ParE family toxin [Pseudomonas sp.]MDE1197880.1 type II toxin-antitoxin system RelE/ParE family toxin [Pseudomonas sp.]